MYYSVLEQHNDGSFWYHGNTFPSRADAEEFMAGWIPNDKERPKIIVEHTKPFPDWICRMVGNHLEFGGLILQTIE